MGLIVKLFLVFLKIGAFNFGGGYAMIQLIATEILGNGWLSDKEFVQIIAIAGMTPGPVAINSATFVGFKTGGFLGALVSTLGVTLPTFCLIIFLAKWLFKYAKHPMMKGLFRGLRPIVAGLILSAVITVSKTTILTDSSDGLPINMKTVLIGIVVFILSIKTKWHPILLIVLAGIAGIVLSYVPFLAG